MYPTKYPRVLFFIAGNTPSPDEEAAIRRIGPGVLVRNASRIKPDTSIEPFDDLAGPAIPDKYKAEYDKRRKPYVPAGDAASAADPVKPEPSAAPLAGLAPLAHLVMPPAPNKPAAPEPAAKPAMAPETPPAPAPAPADGWGVPKQ